MTYSLPFFIKHFSYPERRQNYSEKEVILYLEIMPHNKASAIKSKTIDKKKFKANEPEI